MRLIPLTQGQWALVSDEDYDWLNQWKWYAHKDKKGGYYAYRRQSRKTGSLKPIHMATLILGVEGGILPDHINGDGLDNQRHNLRVADYCQNAVNSDKPTNNTSGYKGVSWNSSKKRWRVELQFRGVRHTRCGFSSPESGARYYDMKMRELAGEFARLNFPDEFDGVPLVGHRDTNVSVYVPNRCSLRMKGNEVEAFSDQLGVYVTGPTRESALEEYKTVVANKLIGTQ
jgi:hypothetical protein